MAAMQCFFRQNGDDCLAGVTKHINMGVHLLIKELSVGGPSSDGVELDGGLTSLRTWLLQEYLTLGTCSRCCGLALSHGLVLYIGITSCTFPPWTELSKKNYYDYDYDYDLAIVYIWSAYGFAFNHCLTVNLTKSKCTGTLAAFVHQDNENLQFPSSAAGALDLFQELIAFAYPS